MSEDSHRLEDERSTAGSSNEGASGASEEAVSTLKPKRGRKSKTPPPSDPLEGLDVEGSPHLQGMSPAWQRLYEAIGKAAKS
ncbi:hypothetical protein PM3016_542 [Paenibacillus mucilaginosus 3016]|uniref:Uncharacterized protein n=1 Tax=Paenibacillus mucilaginosus 3016 TaxID=1116391 RepID=H6NSW8_9BACL|nr:hypothetical protein [Paenibacillus mucilaginosus]AFC27509.1 hypothetical protein PM3016_542 [Paenibacillus mucilaginosus 3016]WFA16408.1 hypothetical protein ERY13_02925 [Paenibacillus mucilaginosus]